MYAIANTLELNKAALVVYEKTSSPYITADGDAFVYIREEDFRKFLRDHQGAVLSDFKKHDVEELCKLCYGAGALKIRVVMPGGKNERCEDLLRNPIKGYVNRTLNYNINLLHETKKKEFLYALDKEKYIVPIRIRNKPKISIEYSIAKISNESYFLAFTSLEEFDLWHSKVGGYEALEVRYDELVELANGDDIILNIFGARYILDQEKIKKIKGQYSETVVQ